MREKEFREYLQGREQDETQIESAVEAVYGFESELEAVGKSLESTSIDDLKGHLARLIKKKENTYEHLIALARYFYSTDRKDLYIYFTAVLGG